MKRQGFGSAFFSKMSTYSMSGITWKSLSYCYYVASGSNSLKVGRNLTWLQDSQNQSRNKRLREVAT